MKPRLGNGKRWFDRELDPYTWSSIRLDIWEHADIAIDMFIFAQTFEVSRLRQDAVDRLVWCHNTAYDDGTGGSFVSTAAIVNA